MPRTFEVPSAIDGSPIIINPLNVAFLRPQQVKRAVHEQGCYTDSQACRVQHPENTTYGMRTCDWSEPEAATEICFVNTIGPQSAATTTMQIEAVRAQLDEGLGYNR